MKIICLGSSSAGNCYILNNNEEAIILEAGVKFSEVKRALNFNLSKIKVAIITHLHGDHSKYIADYLNSGFPVLADESVFTHYGIAPSIIARHQHEYTFGGFSIKPFSVKHDVPNFGYLINHNETGKTVFITDTGEVNYSFKNLNNIMIEANFSNTIIDNNVMNGKIDYVYEERVRESHLSIEKCMEWLQSIDLSNVNNIILLHLSSNNSDKKLFKKILEERFTQNIAIAEKNMTIELNKTPF